MFRRICRLCAFAAVGLVCAAAHAQHTTGRVAGGVFLPTGDDADVAETSFALQLTGDVQLQGRVGVEAEFAWVPINLASTGRPANTLIEARQVSGLIGLRAASHLPQAAAASAYVSGRVGFSRIAVSSDTTASISGWIGRTIDENRNIPPFTFPVRATRNAFVISPRAGVFLPLGGGAIADLSIAPAFLFDGGEVTTQFTATLGFGLRGTLD